VLHDVIPESRVKHPDGHTTVRKKMILLGDWYMARYDLSHDQGRHWVMVSFDRNGKRYETSIYYPEIDYSGVTTQK